MSALELVGIDKSFGGFRALDDVSLAAHRGEVHAVLGENGAGKSTVMNVAAGLYRPDRGRIVVDGVERHFAGPRDAAACGIGMVHQHFKLVQRMTIAENVLLATGGAAFGAGLRAVTADLARRAEALGFAVDPNAPVAGLSVAERQRVEILKVLATGADILILDEPTAVLTEAEGARLLATVRALASGGAAVLLVTHRLAEATGSSDRVTVMRGGRAVATAIPAEAGAAQLAAWVLGAPLETQAADRRGAAGPPWLTVTDLICARPNGSIAVSGASFMVRSGEIYGVAGVGGNGQTELLAALAGLTRPRGGTVRLADGTDLTALPPHRRRGMGIGVIPADRAAYALAGTLPIAENLAAGRLHSGQFGAAWRVDRAAMGRAALAAVTAFDVRGVRGPRQKARELSGGNAQKLVLARELDGARLLVLAQSPTRGLDLRARADVHRRLLEARAQGAAVVLISEDLDEVLALADRVGVMRAGRIVGEYAAPVDRAAVGRLMVGDAA